MFRLCFAFPSSTPPGSDLSFASIFLFVPNIRMPHSLDWTDNRRCSFCGRLCRYFGLSEIGCSICQRRRRRDACSRCDACCRHFSLAVPLAAVPEVWIQIEIFLIGMDPLGSDHQDEMKAQAEIWRTALLGLHDETRHNSDEDYSPFFDLDPYTYGGMFIDHLYMDPPKYFWTLWGLGTWTGGDKLIQDWATGKCSESRVIHIVISFLDPFRPWQVTRAPRRELDGWVPMSMSALSSSIQAICISEMARRGAESQTVRP